MDVKVWMERFVEAVEQGRDVDALELTGMLLRVYLAESRAGTAQDRERFGAAYARVLDRVAARS